MRLEELIARLRLQIDDPFDASGHGGDLVFGRESAECAKRIVELLEPIASGRDCKFENGYLEWPGGGMNLAMLRALLARDGYTIAGGPPRAAPACICTPAAFRADYHRGQRCFRCGGVM